MCQEVPQKNEPELVIDVRNEPVVIASNIEDRTAPIIVSMWERSARVRKVGPCCGASEAVPGAQCAGGIRISLDVPTQSASGDNSHASLSREMFALREHEVKRSGHVFRGAH